MTPQEYAAWIRQYSSQIGLDPALAESIWQQESSGSLDTGLKGPALSRGRGNAIGPWQVVPAYHPDFPVNGDPIAQGKYAMNYLKKVGPAGYYGTGQAMPGQPTTDQYVRQVMGRARGVDVRQASANAGMSTDTDRTPTGNPRSGAMDTQSPMLDPALLASLGILPQAQGQQDAWQDPGPRSPAPQMKEGANPLLLALMGLAGGAITGVGALGGLGAAGDVAGQLDKQNLLDYKTRAEQWRLDEEMSQHRQKLAMDKSAAKRGSGLPPNIQEMLLLKRMYPDMSDSEIMSMAFAGRVPPGGTKVEKVGDRLFNVGYDQMGRPTYSPLGPEEQADYEKTVGSQEKVKKIGETFGKAQVDTLINVSGAYQKAAGALDTTNNLLRRFESGEFDSAVGPVAGRIGQWFDPKTAQLQAMEMSAALANLGIENLAPVSNYEIDLIRKMDASAFQNKAQNIAVLKDLAKVRSAKADALKRALGRLKTESIEEYLANPETIKVDMGAPDTGSPARSESPAAATAPAPAPAAGVGDPDLEAYKKWRGQ